MEDTGLQRVLEGRSRDHDHPSPSSSSAAAGNTPAPSSSDSPSILQSLPLHVSFDHGYYLLVKAIQELREKKDGRVVTVGIGGPCGSGKTSLAEKVASLLGCVVIAMENYRNAADDVSDLVSMDFEALVRNLQDLERGMETTMPVFDFQKKQRTGQKPVKVPSSGVVIVDGAYALHSTLRSLLDIRVAVVGGVHFSLLSKVQYDIGETCSLDHLIDSIFPLFRKHIEPDLHHAQIRINNSFVSSFREAYYKVKCKSESLNRQTALLFGSNEAETETFIEMYLRPPFASVEAKVDDWIKVRQCGIRYYLSLGDQRIVDKYFIIRPKAEFEVGRTTLGGLLALGYNVVLSYKRSCTFINHGELLMALENIDTLNETFAVLKGTNRKVVAAEASKLAVKGPWMTKSYLELILECKGIPRLSTQPPLSATFLTGSKEQHIASPRPIRSLTNIHKLDVTRPWTRSPTKHDLDHAKVTWNFISDSSPYRGNIQLAPLPDTYDLDRGLLLSIQAIQALLENKGFPVIVGIGGPSGSGKTCLARKMANIIGCEVIPLECYYKPEQVKDFKYDEFSSLDLSLLFKNIDDIRNCRKTKLPSFDFENCNRNGFKELQVSEDCGVVIFEGVYALHPDIRESLDLRISVVGGVHSHLIARVQQDKTRLGCFLSQNEIMRTIFPMFQHHIEPHLVNAHLKIQNDFDPVLSPESSLFVLKSNKQVVYQDILRVLDANKLSSSVQNFIDIFLKLGTPSNGQLTERECIRVRICEGRFAVLIREPITEGNFIVQPKVDFDISVSTVAGLLHLGYQAVAYIEASALIYQDGKILIEVDHLQAAPSPYLQIKGTNKEVVLATAAKLCLDGSCTTKTYIQIVLESLPAFEGSTSGIHNQQAARLQELVTFIQSQGGGLSSGSSPRSESFKTEAAIEDLLVRVGKLERWHTINMVLWTFLLSAIVGYSLYQRKQH